MAISLIKIKNKIMTGIYSMAMYAAFRMKVDYVNPEQKKNPPKGIYICNHMAHYDGLVMRAVLKKADLYSLVAGDWFEKKWAKILLFYENSIPVDRNSPGTKWIHDCRAVLKEGKSINIFPEGHTSKSEFVVNEFKPGFLLLASMAKGTPIIPVATVSDYKWFFGRRKHVLIGEPVEFDKSKFGIDPAKSEAYAAEFRDMILDMQKDLREKYYK